MLEAFNGKLIRRTKPFFWKHYFTGNGSNTWPAWAMREGDWKLLIDRSGQRVALFDMAKDRTEKTDVSASNPEVAARMKERLLTWTQSLPAKADPACLHKPHE